MLLRRAVILCCGFFVIVVVSASAQTADFTGTWSGTYSGTKSCRNGAVAQLSGHIKAELLQSGSSVAGAITASDNTTYDNNCVAIAAETAVIPVGATVSGSTIRVAVDPSLGGGVMVISVNGSSMTFTFSGNADGLNLGGTLTRTSAQPPGSDLSGTWTGTFTQIALPCQKPPSVTYSGGVSLTLLQAGSTFSGTATVTNDRHYEQDSSGNCIESAVPSEIMEIVGQVDGSTITGYIIEPNSTNAFTATVSGNTMNGVTLDESPGESVSFTLTRSASGPPAAAILSFGANPSSITAGGSTTLSWSTANATAVSIDNGIGSQPVSGSVGVSPPKSTTYTLTAGGLGGTASASVTVTVGGGGPRLVAGTLPAGMLQLSGQSGATDGFSLANVGTDPANVSLTASGGFFAIAPASLVLQPLDSRTITITGGVQSAGTYDGTIIVSGDGLPSGGMVIPVHLLVAAAPAGSVNPQPAAARVDVSAPAGQNPSGSVSFTNSGSAAMNGIAVADVPWLVPQSGAITINSSQTKSVSFAVDRSKRPDANALLGGATGSISLRFLGSPASAGNMAADTTPTSTVTVTIVDVVKPGVTPGAPPPLQPNELALFVAGHGSTADIVGDVLLANRGRSAIADLKLFLSSSSQFAALPQLSSNVSVTLPSVSTSIFGVELGGSLMLRGTLADLAAAAMRTVLFNGSNVYTTAIPIFRSDRGVGPGGRIVLPGVESTPTTRTMVVVQELSGNAGSAELQAYDVAGAPIGSKVALPIGAFASPSDSAAVVSGARSVVVANTGSGSSRINAYARVTDGETGDSWIATDPAVTSGSTGPFIMPIVSTTDVSAQTEIYLTNISSTPVNATIKVATAANRRRAVKRSSTGSNGSSEQQVTIRPLETQRTSLSSSNGYAVISAAAGSISATGRLTLNAGGRWFGSTLPIVPVSAALSNGEAKRFGGVGDASARSTAAGAAGTSRTALVLLETAGQSATVRVKIWYTFPAGALVSAQTVSSRDFAVAPSQALVITNLARSIIGPQREAFGDLRDMQLDVEVIDGAGRVLPFLESIDNGSRDLLVRSE
ncbi:MAG TPA: hypothetical protein VLV78_02205 [Thermoanaerobaculia bacterium]|nr:hypothetical protein [Thermoanaerobaculia bacterium]